VPCTALEPGGMAASRFLTGIVGAIACATFFVAPASSSPPPGLTTYGRVIWHVDALLHDTFGQRRVWVNPTGNAVSAPRAFSTRFISESGSRRYIFTFANARHSAFRTATPPRPPKAHIGAAGWAIPLMLKRSYISCGNGTWLYEHGGSGPANWELFCGR